MTNIIQREEIFMNLEANIDCIPKINTFFIEINLEDLLAKKIKANFL